jgi:hypothetical protein
MQSVDAAHSPITIMRAKQITKILVRFFSSAALMAAASGAGPSKSLSFVVADAALILDGPVF